jgi:single-stranded DNA-specific DHH superfamily exonuclease
LYGIKGSSSKTAIRIINTSFFKYNMELEISIGSIEKARGFIENISDNDRVALISHVDLDGIASAKIISQLVSPKAIKFVNYGYLNDALINLLKKEKINKVIATDYAMTQKESEKLESFAESLIIDHHQFEKDYNSEKTVFVNAQGYCAAYICYALFEDKENINKFDWLAALASAVDFCYTKNRKFMEKTYEKYGDSFIFKDPRKGKFWDIIENFSFAAIFFKGDLIRVYHSLTESIDSMKRLERYSRPVKKEFENLLSRFNQEKEEIREGYLYVIRSKFDLVSMLATEVSLKIEDKMFIVLGKGVKECRGSARRQDKKINLPKLLQYAVEGFEDSNAGGHIPSSGCSFPIRYLPEFKKRLKEVDLEKFRIK